MLGLHEKKLKYARTSVPPVDVFVAAGCMMPAASFDQAPWEFESKNILQKLGYSPVSEEDMRAVRQAWRGVLHRTDYWARFWGEFSLASDPAPSPGRRLLNNFLRSFTILYFYLLIRITVLVGRPEEPESYGDQFILWEHRFASMKGPFLGGDQPDSVDLLLFGIVQCHASIPVPPLFALQSDPRLGQVRQWIGEMQKRFADYPALHSGIYFEPHSPPPAPAGTLDQLVFWLGSLCMIGCFWLTLPLIGLLAYRNRIRRHAV